MMICSKCRMAGSKHCRFNWFKLKLALEMKNKLGYLRQVSEKVMCAAAAKNLSTHACIYEWRGVSTVVHRIKINYLFSCRRDLCRDSKMCIQDFVKIKHRTSIGPLFKSPEVSISFWKKS
jgi:hypothetical protein